MTKKIIAIAAILIMMTSLAACGETTNFLGGTTQEEKNFVRSDEVYIPIEKIRTLNPIVSKDEDAYYIDKLIYEGLFGLDKNLSLTNVLADSFSYGDDGYSVTIRLKQGIYWQDGEELTADDVKFTLDVLESASYANATLYADNIRNIKYTKLAGKDPYEITIYFNNNTDVSMTKFTFPIIAKHQFKSIDAAKKADADFVPIGSGPYKVSSVNELTHIVLDGNSQYHGGNAPANILNFQIIPEKKDAINLMDVNNISITFSKQIDRDTVYTNKDVNIVSFPSNEVELIGYNFRNPLLQDPRIRQAIAASINTEQIIESAYYKNGVQNDTIYYPNYLGISSKKSSKAYDMEKAKKLLTEAAFIDRNGDGIIENANNESLTISILVNSEDQSRVAAAQVIKSGLDQLAVKSNIVSKDWNGYNSDLASGNFDIFIGGYQLRENYDLRFLLQTNSGNPIGYSNPTLDILLDKLQSGISEKDRLETFKAIKRILISDLPYDCLLYKTYGAIASPSFKGDIQSTFFDLYSGSQSWYSMNEVDREDDSSDEALPDETQQ